jgi:hypothetical protein
LHRVLLVTWLGAWMAGAAELVHNPVERLSAKLEAKELTLAHDGTPRGYLMSLLQALEIDPASQMLVFSKTSLQMDRITPANPRAIYFNDEVAVGFVPGGHLVEFATFDRAVGVTFYAMEVDVPGAPKVERHQGACGSCHSSAPRAKMVVQSVYPMENGAPFISLGTIEPLLVDHRTPFADRWGGWYVTGLTGKMAHRGNAMPKDEFHPFDLEGPRNLMTLAGARLPGKPDLAPYPIKTSDVVALMVFEHQMYVTNLMARLNRLMRNDQARMEGGLDSTVDELVAALFYADEQRLEEPVTPSSEFAAHFAARGPVDHKGRSLRELDLTQRMFRYPFSYMVYSPIYDALPEAARRSLGARIRLVLNGEGAAGFAHLSTADRLGIREILLETKPEVLH